MSTHAIVWLRRDLRLEDNTALNYAIEHFDRISLIFIFDPEITDPLPHNDRRMAFIQESLTDLHTRLSSKANAFTIVKGKPVKVLERLLKNNRINAVLYNRDYEPFAVKRDAEISNVCRRHAVECRNFKDQVIFEPDEIIKNDGQPYQVFTAYKNRWLSRLIDHPAESARNPKISLQKFQSIKCALPEIKTLADLGFETTADPVSGGASAALRTWNKFKERHLSDYPFNRNRLDSRTSGLSPYLRFGNISIRQMVNDLIQDSMKRHEIFLNELIWREFFMMILHYYPHAVKSEFRESLCDVPWSRDKSMFKIWCGGRTGFPVVDAGMRELNATGMMHNRARMITASFLVKHMHIDWRWGERYFAEKLLDFELSSNNGNWQWAAGTGADAAPYFRIFHPVEQGKKFDPEAGYVKRWIPELRDVPAKDIHNRKLYKILFEKNLSLAAGYPPPVIDLDEERIKCLRLYRMKKA